MKEIKYLISFICFIMIPGLIYVSFGVLFTLSINQYKNIFDSKSKNRKIPKYMRIIINLSYSIIIANIFVGLFSIYLTIVFRTEIQSSSNLKLNKK